MKNTKGQNIKEGKISKRRYIIAAGLILLLVIVVLAYALLQPEPKPDPTSARIIRKIVANQLGKDPEKLTDEDLAKVIGFSNGYVDWYFKDGEWRSTIDGYYDIRELENFINLRVVNLTSIDYPESALPKWVKFLAKSGINLKKRYLIDLSPLEKLPNLTELDLSNTSFEDVEKIANLKNLEVLIINNTKVIDIKPIEKLANLKRLYIINTRVSDIKPLEKLKRLFILNIKDCENITDEQVEDLEKALPGLEIVR